MKTVGPLQNRLLCTVLSTNFDIADFTPDTYVKLHSLHKEIEGGKLWLILALSICKLYLRQQ